MVKKLFFKSIFYAITFACMGTIMPFTGQPFSFLSQPDVVQKKSIHGELVESIHGEPVESIFSWNLVSSAVRSLSQLSNQDKLFIGVGVAAALYVSALCTVWFLRSWGFKPHSFFWWRPNSYSFDMQKNFLNTAAQKNSNQKINKTSEKKKPFFLKNGGNTCYIDSVVSALIHNQNFCKAICALDFDTLNPSLIDDFIKNAKSDLKTKKKACEAELHDWETIKNGYRFLKALKDLIIYNKNFVFTTDTQLFTEIHKAGRAWFGGGVTQQCAQELWAKIQITLDWLHVKTSIASLQKGSSQGKNDIVWQSEKDVSFDLLSPIQVKLLNNPGGVIKQSSLLKRILPKEEVTDQPGRINFLRFVEIPETLVLSLDRFKQIENDQPKKITAGDSAISLPETMDLADLEFGCSDELKKSSHTRYALSSVVCHSGSSISSGHYVTYVKYDKDWYLMDDQSSSAQLLGEDEKNLLFAGTPSGGDPVIVFYDQQP